MISHRLPGVRFQTQAPLPDANLPRMDIAVFVGFATSGDLHKPVAVESSEEFSAIFGDDLPLAWDQAQGNAVRAYLAPSVRAFFRNGGRRCWIIRLPTPEPNAFDAGLFLDPALSTVNGEHLLAEADYIRYQANHPRDLTGIHAALAVDEATLIAVPDALHIGWGVADIDKPRSPQTLPTPDRPEWRPHPWCPPDPTSYPESQQKEPQLGNFLDSQVRVLKAPYLQVDGGEWALQESPIWVGKPQAVTLAWTVAAQPHTHYRVQQATRFDFADAVTIYMGDNTSVTLQGRSFGDYYFQVRAEVAEQFSDWSNGLAVRLAETPITALNSSDDFQDVTLLSVQRALLQMCAARGDLFAVLSLPAHYRSQTALEHIAKLQLSERERSFGALFHPWLVGREENRPEELQITPPDGAICGVMAKRAIERGAWISPANEPLRGVVALTPAIDPQQWPALDCAQINLIRQEPHGFLTLSAETLSGSHVQGAFSIGDGQCHDSELALISVRRLLMLLRRLALREGAAYVFEPNDDSFRRMVKRHFENIFEQLFVRGAFAGRSSSYAYRVVTDNTINTSAIVDQGHFLVELQVAPSQPLKFLTVRLLHSGDQLLVSETAA